MDHTDIIKDTDAFFEIYPITKEITNKCPDKTKVMQYDHNSERFTFCMPQFVEGHDMLGCKVEVRYINIDTNTKEETKGLYEVKDVQKHPEKNDHIMFSWLLSQNVTRRAGVVHFLIRFSCVDYAWSTDKYRAISVAEGIYDADVIEELYADVFEQWKAEILAEVGDVKKEVDEAKETALTEMNTAKTKAVKDIQEEGQRIADSLPDGKELSTVFTFTNCTSSGWVKFAEVEYGNAESALNDTEFVSATLHIKRHKAGASQNIDSIISLCVFNVSQTPGIVLDQIAGRDVTRLFMYVHNAEIGTISFYVRAVADVCWYAFTDKIINKEKITFFSEDYNSLVSSIEGGIYATYNKVPLAGKADMDADGNVFPDTYVKKADLNIESGEGVNSIQQKNTNKTWMPSEDVLRALFGLEETEEIPEDFEGLPVGVVDEASEGATSLGVETTSSGKGAFSSGINTISLGDGAFSAGKDTLAMALAAAFGLGTFALHPGQFVRGMYNEIDHDGKYVDVVGGGFYDQIADETGEGLIDVLIRRNLYALDWGGNAYFAGDVYVGKDRKKLAKEEELETMLGDIETALDTIIAIQNQLMGVSE